MPLSVYKSRWRYTPTPYIKSMPVYPCGVYMSIAFHCLMQHKEPRWLPSGAPCFSTARLYYISPWDLPGGAHPTGPVYPDRRVRRMDPDLLVRLAVVQ